MHKSGFTEIIPFICIKPSKLGSASYVFHSLSFHGAHLREWLQSDGLCVLSCSVMSNCLWPHGLYPARSFCPWNFPGKNTGVGCHFLLHWVLPSQGSNPSFLELSLKHCNTSRWQPITKYCESPYYVLATRLIKKEIKGKRRRRNSHSLSTYSVPDTGEGVMLVHLVLTTPYVVRITVCVTYTQFQVKK